MTFLIQTVQKNVLSFYFYFWPQNKQTWNDDTFSTRIKLSTPISIFLNESKIVSN